MQGLQRIAQFLEDRKQPGLAAMLRKLERGELKAGDVEALTREQDAAALEAKPLTARPYPTQVCVEYVRLAQMSRMDRARALDRSEYDDGLLRQGRNQHRAWYQGVRDDLEHLYATAAFFKLDGPGSHLWRQLERLAEAYVVMQEAHWPKDRAHRDGTPCTTPEMYRRIARRVLGLQQTEASRAADDSFGGPSQQPLGL